MSPPAAGTPAPRSRRGPRPAVLLLAALGLTAVTYANALQGGFVWDDRALILESPAIHRLDPRAHLGSSFWDESATRAGDAFYYRPLVSWSYAADWALGDGRPWRFHATNVLVHLAVVALVFALARRAGAGPVGAGLGAALFGVFPRLTEDVSWISGRTDLLAAGLGLGALWLHRADASLARRSGAALLLLLGLLAKEVAAAAAVGLLVLELAAVRRGERSARAALAALAPAAVACAAYALLRAHGLSGGAAHVEPPAHRAAMPLQALGTYATMLLDPRPNLQIGLLGDLDLRLVALGILVAGGATWWAARACRRPPEPLRAGLWACAAAALGLVLHLVLIRVAVVAADRFLYVPLACLAALLPAPATRLLHRVTLPATAAAVALLGAYGLLTVQRNEDWADEVRLWRRATETAAPANQLPWNELGSALSRASRPEEALVAYQAALQRARTREASLRTRANLAATLADLGRLEEAQALLARLAAEAPERAVHHYDLAVADLRLLRFDAAEASLARALQLRPDYAEARDAQARLPALRQAVQELPPEAPAEPLALRVRRARLWTQLSWPPRAAPLWASVLEDPGAGAALVTEGAAYVVARGGRDQAVRAVARARAAGLPAGTLGVLEQALADRFPALGAGAGGSSPAMVP